MIKAAPLGLLLALVAAACSSASVRTEPDVPVSPESRLAADVARAACAAVSGCCVSRRLGAFDGATCETLVRGTLESVARLRKESGGGRADVARASACLAKIEAYRSSCIDPEWPASFLDTGPCDELFGREGHPVGSACETSAQCARPPEASRAWCDAEDHRCELFTSAKKGEACVGDCDEEECGNPKTAKRGVDAFCDAQKGLSCDASTKLCRARGALEESCDPKRPCVLGAFCKAGRCTSQGPVGASCAESTNACIREAECDPGSKTCVARKKEGDSCSDDADCATGNCAGRVCRGKKDATMLRLGVDLRLFCAPE